MKPSRELRPAISIWVAMAVFLLYAIEISSGEVRYVCFSKGENMLKLRCPEGQRIKVEEARYGSDRFGTCLLLNPRPGGGDLNCTHITNVSLDCCGQQSCNVSVDKVYLPTCYRASTFLRVVYECVLDQNVTCGWKEEKRVQPPGPDLPDRRPSEVPAETPSPQPVTTHTPDAGPQTPSHTSIRHTPSEVPPWGGENKITSVRNQARRPEVAGDEPINDRVSDGAIRAVWACLGVGLIIIVFLSVLLVLSCRRKRMAFRSRGKVQRREHTNRNIEVQESEFGCRKAPEGGGDTSNNNDTKSLPEKGHINTAFQITDERGSHRRKLSPIKTQHNTTDAPNGSLSDSGVDVSSSSAGSSPNTAAVEPGTPTAPPGGSDTISRKRKHPDTEVVTTPSPENQ